MERKPTKKQIDAVNEMVVNGGKAQPAMRKAGYSENTLKTPKKLTESLGFKQLCDECGLTEDLIVGCLVEDINLKPQNRKQELELGARIRGMLVDRTDHTSKGDRIMFLPPELIDKNELSSNAEPSSEGHPQV